MAAQSSEIDRAIAETAMLVKAVVGNSKQGKMLLGLVRPVDAIPSAHKPMEMNASTLNPIEESIKPLAHMWMN